MESTQRQRLFDSVEALKETLTAMALAIWERPELGYQERFASSTLADFLESQGFSVQRGIGDFDTAFIARKGSGPLHIGFCAEYDALPNGHACGHNLFCCSAVGAAAAFAASAVEAETVVIGSPSEESGVTGSSGKIYLLREGAYEGLDMAMIAHADGQSVMDRRLIATTNEKFIFTGKASHAGGSPEQGINALTAGVNFLNGMNAMRQQFFPGMLFNAVIAEGGVMASTIPDRCAVNANIRARDHRDLEKLLDWTANFARGAAMMNGCGLEIVPPKTACDDLRPNRSLLGAYKESMDLLGQSYCESDTRGFGWDMGSVGYRIPVIAPYHKIGPDDLVCHSDQFRECARSPLALQALMTAAKCMAYTAARYCQDRDLREAVAAEFQTYRR